MGFSIEFKYKTIYRLANDWSLRAVSLKPAFDKIGRHMLRSVDLNFNNKGRYDLRRNVWAPLSPATIARRPKGQRANPRPLIATGRLKNSIKYKATSKDLRIGTSVRYGIYHQQDGRFSSSLSKGNWRLPARPFIRFHAQDKKFAAKVISAFIRGRKDIVIVE